VPAPSTLSKINTRCAEDAVVGLHEATAGLGGRVEVGEGGKVRADTTVASVDVEYPADSGLLAPLPAA
jgi:hypothetical protein